MTTFKETMSFDIYITKFMALLSVLGSSFIVLSYLRFTDLQDYTFTIVANMAIANAIMSFSMVFLHGYIVVPLCSTSTVIFYTSASSYILFVSIVSYLLFRKVCMNQYSMKEELKKNIVVMGWLVPLLWLAIPSAFPAFWSIDGKLIDGCKSLEDAYEGMEVKNDNSEIESAEETSDVYFRGILRLSIFLFIPSSCAIIFNCYTIYRTNLSIREVKRLAATQKWLSNTPVLSFESMPSEEMFNKRQLRSRWTSGRDQYGLPEEFLEYEHQHNPSNATNHSVGRTIPFLPTLSGTIRNDKYIIDIERRAAINSMLMERFSRYPLVLVSCWLVGFFVFIIYLLTGTTKIFELAIFHFANFAMATSGLINAGVLLMSPHIFSRWKHGTSYDLLDSNMYFRDDISDSAWNENEHSSDFAPIDADFF
mmetsp:Transcript_14573/g.19035  ORF Transcript_14573/g.19035 Transcript_14573/m.19035 type:complete len:422 (+) Transcript_14573:320-1585(+)